MCGIVGYFSGFPKKGGQLLLEKMVNELSHRGPDGIGFYHSSNVGFAIARLSIVDLAGGMQPLFNEDKSIVVVGNGEIYNHVKLRKDLIQRGHIFSCNSDIEVISHLYEEFGITAFGKLRGMYGISLWDSKKEVGYLARDPAGKKSIYYTKTDDETFFSSEIKSLVKCMVNIQPNLGQVKRALAYRSSSSCQTCFKDIYKLPRSTILKFSKKAIELIPYEPEFLKQPLSITEALYQSIERRLMADVPIGSFLSGGLDSSIIAALMRKFLGPIYKLHTFCVGYGMEGDEFEKARIVADHIRSIHHEVVVDTVNVIRDFDKIVWHMDEPTLNPAIVPSFYLSQEAKKYVKVVLVGDGADEIFAGYDKHRELLESWYAGNIDPRQFFRRRMPFEFEMLEKLNINIDPNIFLDWEKDMRQSKNPEQYLNSAMRIDKEEMLPNLQLMTVDRSAMAHGLEARVPFLDVDLIRAVEVYGVGNLILDGIGKVTLRKIASEFLPESIFNREKQIYFVPINHWMQNGMDGFFRERILQSDILPQILDINQLKINLANLTPYQKWSLLVVDSWFRTFFRASHNQISNN